jgi:hypothetical protein
MSTDNPTPKPRSVDERLEGLTQTVEIIASMQRDNERRFGEIQESIAQLARIAEIHEHRLTDIEGGEQQ